MFSGSSPSVSRYALKSGAYTYMFSTLGMPTRNVARFFISSARCFTSALKVHFVLGIGSEVFGGFCERHTPEAAIST